LTLLTLTDTLGTVKGRLQPYASSMLAKWNMSNCQCKKRHELTQSDLERATVAVDIRGNRDSDSIPRVGDVLLVQQLGALRTDNLNVEVPRSSTLQTRCVLGWAGEALKTYLEVNRNIYMASTATTNEPLGPTRNYVISGGEVRRSERVDDLFNTRAIERNLLVIGIAETSERELVVTALIWLESNFATRTSDGLGQVARGLLVLLGLVIHLEGSGTAENERCRDTGIARTSERLSMIHIGL